jgi:hypothetical protein
MAFDIPNRSAAAYEAQSILDSTDIDILIAGIAGTEVVSGCAVTAQGSPDMTVAVASGVVKVAGTTVSVSSGNVTISAAHSSLDRRDLVVVNNAGTKSVTAGTAAATPIKPAIPANSIVLAEIYVPAADTDIDADQIIDKRVDVASGGGSTLAAVAYDPGSEVTKVTTSALAMTALDTTNLRLTFTAPPSGRVWCASGSLWTSAPAFLLLFSWGFWTVRLSNCEPPPVSVRGLTAVLSVLWPRGS